MKRGLRRAVLVAVAAFVAVYGGDWAIYQLRGSPQLKVSVNRTLTIPLKGNKQEFDSLGMVDVPCSVSLFPQGSESPCWYLRRNSNQNTQI